MEQNNKKKPHILWVLFYGFWLLFATIASATAINCAKDIVFKIFAGINVVFSWAGIYVDIKNKFL